jgi:hypothetical protein
MQGIDACGVKICGGAASAVAGLSIDGGALASPSSALLVTCVTVQQHAARTDASCAGVFFLCGSAFVGQQQTERVLPSYAHRYQDAVAIDGTRSSVSRIRTTRRTCRHYTRLTVEGNAAHLRSPCGRPSRVRPASNTSAADTATSHRSDANRR